MLARCCESSLMLSACSRHTEVYMQLRGVWHINHYPIPPHVHSSDQIDQRAAAQSLLPGSKTNAPEIRRNSAGEAPQSPSVHSDSSSDSITRAAPPARSQSALSIRCVNTDKESDLCCSQCTNTEINKDTAKNKQQALPGKQKHSATVYRYMSVYLYTFVSSKTAAPLK